MMKTSVQTKTSAQTKAVRYHEAMGGRKTAFARARVFSGAGSIVVNEKDYKAYFRVPKLQDRVLAVFRELGILERVQATVQVWGGGINAQADAVRNAIARAMVKLDETSRKKLRRLGYMTRDARMVERKKYGYRKARRAPQWKKR